MKRALKILAALLIVAVIALGVTISHDSACPTDPWPGLAAGSVPMKAAVYRCYGPPEVVKIEHVAKPVPSDEEVLVKVHAAGINPLDWHYMRGVPYIMRLESGFLPAEGPAARRRFLGHGRGRRQERHELQARGRGVRREERRVRRVRRRERGAQRPDKARAHHVRAGGGGADRGGHRAAGPARQGRTRGGAEGADQRRLGRRGHFRRADREGVRCRGDRRRAAHATSSWCGRSGPIT